MKTITFYSYKGGAGRSLALANAAVYLAKLGFKVVALDFDLEAPGLHYKLTGNDDGSPLQVERGVVDYLSDYLAYGQVASLLSDFIVTVPIPGIEKPLVYLMPAGRAPSPDYWSKLSRINWHDLFYLKGAQGVQIFKELQLRVLDELRPDFLLVDSRTGITEMGGVATTLLADKVLCLVLPSIENLDGARAVVQSLKRSRRESGGAELDVIVAVSRLPEMRGGEDEKEREVTDRIRAIMNLEAEDSQDTLALKEIFVLHSEAALQVKEVIRVGGGTNPDDSVLLRDYLRLFAPFVPKESIEPKLNDLIDKAWQKLRQDPDAAVKDMEQYAESFGHPETYRELLRFYQVRNAPPMSILRRAQRLWEITRASNDEYLWALASKHFQAIPPFQRKAREWYPNLDFLRALWREAGRRNAEFGLKLAEAYNLEDEESVAADILIEVIRYSGPTSLVLSRSIHMLDFAERGDEADALIQEHKPRFASEPEFVAAWARHVLRSPNKTAVGEIAALAVVPKLRPSLAALVYLAGGRPEQAVGLAQPILAEITEREVPTRDLDDLAGFFREIGLSEDFEKAVMRGYPADIVRGLRERAVRARRR